MTRPPRTFKSALALLAGLMLMVQTSLVAAGDAARVTMLDVFGNPLCITSADDVAMGGHGIPGDEHSPATNCCTLACGGTGSSLDGTMPVSGASLLRPLALAGAFPVARTDIGVRSPGHDPANPRAPPAVV